ncbi:flagellin [Methylomonas sp. BW4-1]|uniref:flagellin n=1 Tax=Methylomonas sp. BW4-1 TaxID=3376685 RepID=UPI004041B1C3
MLSSINTNNLDKSQSLIQTSIQRLSSAKRINSAADNPAGVAIADAISSRLGGQNQAIGNIGKGLSLTDTAGSALTQVTDNLQRIRELTVQAGNGSLSAADRQSLQDEINGLGKSIDGIAGNTQFNDQKLLDGSFSGQLQIGPNPGDTLGLSLSNVSSTALGVSGLDVSSAANASNALDSIDSAIKHVGNQQGNLASTAAGLNSNLANLSSSYQNLAETRSRIQDTDYAQTAADLNKGKLQNQVASYALKLYQDNQKAASALLTGI